MKWILSCFADIRDWVPSKDLFYKRYRDNNKFCEFRGRSDKAGIFVDISKELDSFLSGSNTAQVEGRNSVGDDSGGPSAGGGHDGKKLIKTGNQRKVRNFENSSAILGHNVLKGEKVVTVSNKNGRPTRDFLFKLTTDILALKVSVPEGGKRVVSWLNPQNSLKPIKSGNSAGKSVVSWTGPVKSQWPTVVGPVASQTQAQAHAHVQA